MTYWLTYLPVELDIMTVKHKINIDVAIAVTTD